MNSTMIDWRRIILFGNQMLLSWQAREVFSGLNYQTCKFVAAVSSLYWLFALIKIQTTMRFWLVRPIICVDSVNDVRICIGTTLHQ